MELINKNDPTPEEYDEIKRKVDNLGRSDLDHDISNHLSVLLLAMSTAKTNGWNDKRRNMWDRRVILINQIIKQVNDDKAKEKDQS